MNPITVAWFLMAFWLFVYAARVLIADLREQQTRPGPSWCVCDPACEVADA